MSKTTSKQINEYNQMSLTVEKFKNQNCTKFIKQTFKNTRKFSFCFNKTSCFQIELDKLMCLLFSQCSFLVINILLCMLDGLFIKNQWTAFVHLSCYLSVNFVSHKALKVLSCIKLLQYYQLNQIENYCEDHGLVLYTFTQGQKWHLK